MVMQYPIGSRASRSWLISIPGVILGASIWAATPPTAFGQADESLTFSTKSPQVVNPISSNAIATQQKIQQGKQLYDAGQFSPAVQVWQQAFQAAQNRQEMLNQAAVLNHLSLAYQRLGEWNKANQASAQGLKLLLPEEKNPQHLQLLAQTLNTQGSLQLALGESQTALRTWQKAKSIYEAAGDSIGIAYCLLNQATVLQASGFNRKAVDTLNSMRQTLQTQPDSLLKIVGLRSLGNALLSIGEIKQSRQVLQQSLFLAQKLRSPQDIAAANFGLGNVARVQQDTQAARAFYQLSAAASTDAIARIQAQLNQLSLLLETKQLNAARALSDEILPSLTSLPNSRQAIYAQINLSGSLMKLGVRQRDTAIILAKAIQQARNLKDRRAYAYAIGSLGSLYEQNQQWSDAKHLTIQALNTAQGMDAPEINYRFLWQLGRILKATGNSQGAIAAYTEAVKALKSLRSNLVAVNPDIQFDFRDEVEPVYRQSIELLLQPKQPSQQNLRLARDTLESLQLAQLDNFFRSACLEGKPVQVDTVVDKQDPKAAVIYPIILADRLEVILKLPHQPLRHYRTRIAAGEVEKLLKQLRSSLTKPYTLLETQALSKQVYNWLIRPAETELRDNQIETLVFVLDGELRNIPMSTLYDGQQYLVQKYALAIAPGLQLLPQKPFEQVKLKALTAGLTIARSGFSALTNVGVELKRINSVVASTTLLNQKFTSTQLQNQLEDVPFPIVHLATHGQFSSVAEKTFILAWDKPIVVNELNNLLRKGDPQRDIIELLVLSACSTAAGDNRAALGLAGVAVRAGARSTLASLWSLDDESSALLMSQFYRELTDNKLNKAEALRQAQNALLQNPRYQHPRYWAAFVLLGNWL